MAGQAALSSCLALKHESVESHKHLLWTVKLAVASGEHKRLVLIFALFQAPHILGHDVLVTVWVIHALLSAVDGACSFTAWLPSGPLIYCCRLQLQDTPSLENLKLKYYQLLIRYHSHNNSYIDICRCYKAIYETDSIAEDPEQWKPVSSSQKVILLQLSSICIIASTVNIIPGICPCMCIKSTGCC